MRKCGILFFLVQTIAMGAFAQNKQVREGNKLYSEKKYVEAAEAYKKALEKDPTSTPGMFNMGNALMRQKNYEGARQALQATARQSRDRAVKANANYNVGNTYMEEKKWQEAVEAYKNALRINPQDEAAKYNLSYALKMLKQQQDGGGGKNKDQDQNNDNKQDQNEQNNQDSKDKNQDQNEKDQDKQDQSQQPQRPQESKLSEQQAEQLLNALSQEEKKLHDKKEKGKAVPVRMDKDW